MTLTAPPSAAQADAVAPAPTVARTDERAAWRRALLFGGVAFVISRLCVLAGAGVASSAADPRPATATDGILDVLTSWDGRWYLEVVRDWYPTSVPPGVSYNVGTSARAAFFPAYPILVSGADRLLPFGDTFAALAINAVLGALVVFMVGVLARRLYGPAVAQRAMVLTALFPGSFVLSFAYSEPLLLCFAAAALLALLDRRWLLAGVFGALASASRPNGVAVAAACAVAAAIAIWRDREWRALIAPILAPLGFIVFQVYLSARANEEGVWFRVQREAWDEGWSFGSTAIEGIVDTFSNPLSSPRDILTTLSVLAMLAGIYAAWKVRLPAALTAYTAVVLALMILPSTVTARPRFLFTAFPLLIAVAAAWPRDEHDGWSLVLATCAAGLVAVVGLFGLIAAIP